MLLNKHFCVENSYIFAEAVIFRLHWWIESSKEQHLFETEIFCNIINVFTVTFDQFHVFLVNKYINFFKKKQQHLNSSVFDDVLAVWVWTALKLFLTLWMIEQPTDLQSSFIQKHRISLIVSWNVCMHL